MNRRGAYLRIFIVISIMRFAYMVSAVDSLDNAEGLNASIPKRLKVPYEDSLLTSMSQIGSAIAMDSAGRLYVALGGKPADFRIAKYDESGRLCWLKTYDGPGNGDDFAGAITVDAYGNVYVTGYSLGSDGNFDYATIKYGDEGNRLWVRRYDGPAKGNDLAAAIAVDNDGNVYVTGASRGCTSDFDFATVKYDRQGERVWVRRYNGPGNNADWGEAVSVDEGGNVRVTGLSPASDGSEQYAAIKYDRFGNELHVEQLISRFGEDNEPV